MINNYKKNKKYVVLKDGNNYGLLVGVLILVLVCVLLFTSKMWLPDSRKNMSSKMNSEIYFTMNTSMIKSYSIDYKTGVGELLISQEKASDNKKYDLSYKVFDDKGNELPYEVINGSAVKEDENSVKVYQDTLIQFGVYDDIYFVKIEISQKDTTTQNVIVDYRSFKNKRVLEKGKDYLINLEKERDILNNEMDHLKPLEEQSVVLNKELKSIMKLDKKEREEKQSRIDELKREITFLDEKIKPLKKEIAAQKKKIAELE